MLPILFWFDRLEDGDVAPVTSFCLVEKREACEPSLEVIDDDFLDLSDIIFVTPIAVGISLELVFAATMIK